MPRSATAAWTGPAAGTPARLQPISRLQDEKTTIAQMLKRYGAPIAVADAPRASRRGGNRST